MENENENENERSSTVDQSRGTDVHKTPGGDYVRRNANGGFECLKPDALRVWGFVLSECEESEAGVPTTLEAEGFVACGANGHEAWMRKAEQQPQSNLDPSPDAWLTAERGGFTVAATVGAPFVTEMHAAVRAYADWTPSTASGRRLKDTIDRLEARARVDEDEFHFRQGEAAPAYDAPPI